MLRKHQGELDHVIEGIIKKKPDLKDVRRIILSVVAGGGKGSVVVNAGKLLRAGLVSSICCIVPRQSLQTQCEAVCQDPFFQKLFKTKISIRASTNDFDPCRGMDGFVTTYQALGVDKTKSVLREVSTSKYCLILDEFHHVEHESPWHDAVNDIIGAAEFVIMMSGTLSRANKQRIACVDYKDGLVKLDNDPETYVIKYSRSDALREKAILPIKFDLFDASASWSEYDTGKTKVIDSFGEVKPGDESKALFTALKTEFKNELIRHSLAAWLGYKQKTHRSKILFVCSQIADAEDCLAYLSELGINALIATSNNPAQCSENIATFKCGGVDALVTVAVAYEGLDVPEISHICIITRIRSKEWLEQCVSRAVRVSKISGKYEDQAAYIFAPEDKLFLEFVEAIESEQRTRAMHKQKLPEQIELFPVDEIDSDSGGEINTGPCVPIGSEIKKLAKLTFGEVKPFFTPRQITPKEKEKELRRSIDTHLKYYAKNNGYEIPHINREAKKINGKPRHEMTLYELELFYKNIKNYFPLSQTRPNNYTTGRFELGEEKFF